MISNLKALGKFCFSHSKACFRPDRTVGPLRLLSSRISGVDVDQAKRIEMRDNKLRSDYEQIKAPLGGESLDDVRRKRLIYRSKQRGWLEVDILLGSWAAINVPHMTTEEMDDYERIIKEETIDIFNYVSGKDALPDHLKDSKMMKVLQEYALNSGVINPDKYKEIKQSNNLI